jgi:fructose-1-phosphate kinase PfkB-like protein
MMRSVEDRIEDAQRVVRSRGQESVLVSVGGCGAPGYMNEGSWMPEGLNLPACARE